MVYMKKAKCLIVIVVMVLYIFSTAVHSVYGTSSSDGNLTEGNVSSDSVKKDWLSESEKKAYEEAIGREYKESKVIATYGKLPKLETEEQKLQWFDNLSVIIGGVRNKILPYIYPKGPVIIYGYDHKGYIDVTFEENLTIENTLIDEIYAIIDEEAKKMGIQEVPVEFTYSFLPQFDVKPSSQNGETTTTSNINKTTSAQRNEISTEKSVSGFGLWGGLISMFSWWLFRKK